VKKPYWLLPAEHAKHHIAFFDMNATYFYTKLDMENDFICVQIKLEYLVGQ
jgi:hypothetical protein